MNPNE